MGCCFSGRWQSRYLHDLILLIYIVYVLIMGNYLVDRVAFDLSAVQPADQTSALLAAVDIVGQWMATEDFAKHYVEQNKEFVDEVTANTIDAAQVIHHFKNAHPKILIEDLVIPVGATQKEIDELHESYGYTQYRESEGGVVIVLYRNIVRAAFKTGEAFRRFDLIFVKHIFIFIYQLFVVNIYSS